MDYERQIIHQCGSHTAYDLTSVISPIDASHLIFSDSMFILLIKADENETSAFYP
jgi:hypothetical protein